MITKEHKNYSKNLSRTIDFAVEVSKPVENSSFKLGRKSVYMVCPQGHKQKDFELAEYFSEAKHCLVCEHIREDVLVGGEK